jgi:hypothetical protein
MNWILPLSRHHKNATREIDMKWSSSIGEPKGNRPVRMRTWSNCESHNGSITPAPFIIFKAHTLFGMGFDNLRY